MSPTIVQMHLLRYIAGHIEARDGVSPTLREIGAATERSSKGSLSDMLCRMEDRGLIRRLHGRACAIEVLRPVSIPRAPDGAPLYFVKVGQ